MSFDSTTWRQIQAMNSWLRDIYHELVDIKQLLESTHKKYEVEGELPPKTGV